MTTRFTDLTEIAAVDIADTDVMALSDVSVVGEGSRKVTIASLRTTVGAVELSQVQVEDDTSTVFGSVSGERLGQAIAVSREKSGTPVATTSGTAFDFTSIPAEVQEITVVFVGVSLTGTDGLLVQMGTSGGVVTSGYLSTGIRTSGAGGGPASSTSGMVIGCSNAATVASGTMKFTRLAPGSNVWAQDHNMKETSGIVLLGSGDIDLGAEVDRIRITRTGTNTFDAGTVNVRWK